MIPIRLACLALCLIALTSPASPILQSTQQVERNDFIGSWELTVEYSAAEKNKGNEGHQLHGSGSETLTITKNGDEIQVAHKTPRNYGTYHANVQQSTIGWTETTKGQDRNSTSLVYKAILEGDEMKGTITGPSVDKQFVARRLRS